MSTARKKPLLAPGNEEEWARINEEEARQEAEFAAALSIPERLEFGQRLCDQAFDFYNAVHADDRGSQDRVDLEKLERANGELPVDPIPGLDA